MWCSMFLHYLTEQNQIMPFFINHGDISTFHHAFPIRIYAIGIVAHCFKMQQYFSDFRRLSNKDHKNFLAAMSF